MVLVIIYDGGTFPDLLDFSCSKMQLELVFLAFL